MSLSGLRRPEPKAEAAIRSGVVISLIEKYLDLMPDFKSSLPNGSFAVTLKSGEISHTLNLNGGKRGVSLLFPAYSDMIKILSGERGRVIPLPTSVRFLPALNSFQTCAGAVSRAMALQPSCERERLDKLPLLLTAALAGVAQVYNHDRWISVKASHIPMGTIGVHVSGDEGLGGVISVTDGGMAFNPHVPGERENARLIFSSPEVCYDVLSGAMPAMAALGDGRVRLMGRLPLIQGLFPLLDRFGEIMS